MDEPLENEIIHKEIDLIQSCITRMAHNSFLIKGWCITIVAVVLALAEKAMNPMLLSAILLLPILSFWYLDAFFLQTEKMYRKMYSWALDARQKGSKEFLYDLNPHRFKEEVESKAAVMWSVTLRYFYGIPALIVLGIIFFQFCPLSQKSDSGSKEVVEHLMKIELSDSTKPDVVVETLKKPEIQPVIE